MIGIKKIRNGQVKHPERLGAFLRGLARNLSIQLYRGAASRATCSDPSEPAVEVTDDREDPLNQLMQKERFRLVREVIKELNTERDRQVLFRYYMADQTGWEICRDLDLHRDHFYRVLYRARRRFRSLWEERMNTSSRQTEGRNQE